MIHSVETIRDAVSAAARDTDIKRAYLFGSYARGDAKEDSDVDLCLETGASFSLVSAGTFVSMLERELRIPVDITTERALFPTTRANMLADRVLVYERS